MAAFENLKFSEREPVYLQIIRYVKVQAYTGALKNGDEVPSRRVLAAILGINPGTVQKAYRILEDEGLLVTLSNARSEVRLDEAKLAAIGREMTGQMVRDFIKNVRDVHLTLDELIVLIRELWDDPESGGFDE